MIAGLGISPIGWSNEDLPALGADNSLETCLADIVWAKYDGVELGVKFPQDEATLRPLLATHDLVLISGSHDGLLLERSVEAEFDAMRDRLNLLRAMECDILLYRECSGAILRDPDAPLKTRPVMAEGNWAGYAEKLSDLAERVSGQGLRLACRHHVGSVIKTEEEIARLMDMTRSNVGLVMDTGHAKIAGIDVEEMAEKHAERLVHVHAKDVRFEPMMEAREGNLSMPEAIMGGVFCVPGSGIIDFSALLSVLGEIGYEGWLVVEADQDPAKANPRDNATLGRRNLEALTWITGLN